MVRCLWQALAGILSKAIAMAAVTVSGSILQLADDDSTSTLNLEKKRRDDRLW
ncbi:hypothetical protein N657DRAFT_651266 [Parathielavia appendiculata]|uniref:Uncharacterized protein n=1 Tax=Parathielavia appendiculata TaxID=2587402 RepID=A0AAN6YYJ9_9PEZI|nr:hypothetical protein N657DRAFT_651266 [Parathielavia appendiculata]